MEVWIVQRLLRKKSQKWAEVQKILLAFVSIVLELSKECEGMKCCAFGSEVLISLWLC